MSVIIPPVKIPAIKSPRQPLVLPAQAREGLIYAMLPLADGGSRVIDYSGNEHHGNPVGTTWKTKGRRGPALDFTPAACRVNTGADWLGTSALTIIFSMWPDGYGAGVLSTLINNGKIWLYYFQPVLKFYYSSDGGSTNGQVAASTIPFGEYSLLVFTRTAAGVGNLYRGTETIEPTRIAAANQSTGTPAAGTTDVFIGNRSSFDVGFDGQMNTLLAFDQVLPTATINEIWRQVVR